jgi:hypothetical protein
VAEWGAFKIVQLSILRPRRNQAQNKRTCEPSQHWRSRQWTVSIFVPALIQNQSQSKRYGCQAQQARQPSWAFEVLPWSQRSGRSRSTRIATSLEIPQQIELSAYLTSPRKVSGEALKIWIALSQTGFSGTPILSEAHATELVILGPGAWSIGAQPFGRRGIICPA